MKKSAKANKSNAFRMVILSIVALTATYTLLPDYLQKALIYLNPDIDDHRIFDNREVKISQNTHPWPFSSGYNQASLSASAVDSLEIYETVAFLVIKHDSILFERYWNKQSPTTLSNSFSMAKSIVSLLIGCAIEEGHIKGLDEKVVKYLPNLKGSYSNRLTIRHLLSMSSASSWDESYKSPFSITTQAYYGRNLEKTTKKIEIVQQPGIVFRYRSGDTQLLASILKTATGQTISEYASEKLWQPLGAESQALWSLDHKGGTEKAFCCFNSNARDFARIGHIVLNKGTFNNNQLIPKHYIREMTTPVNYLTDDDAKMVDYYGLHWWILNYKGQKIPYARGILGQYIFVLPAQRAVIVRLGNKRSDVYRAHHPADAFTWLESALEIIENQ
jgi:CubicO group peptidase (beta-lactamase class C family)